MIESRAFQCSSASRKFLNLDGLKRPVEKLKFQCSSASRKFLKGKRRTATANRTGFSALQRAENSSTLMRRCTACLRRAFQCSSASRKFLKSSREQLSRCLEIVSVLFSEPKIPQAPHETERGKSASVSVLFSEPKIPQLNMRRPAELRDVCFSALQRAENSSSL